MDEKNALTEKLVLLSLDWPSSLSPCKTSTLDEKESFRIASDPTERYEILFREGSLGGSYVVRDVEGHVSKLPGTGRSCRRTANCTNGAAACTRNRP